MQLYEEAWNATEYCRTIITNPGYMKENFIIKLETYCCPDKGDQENVHELTAEQLAIRKVVVTLTVFNIVREFALFQVIHIDIGNDPNFNVATQYDPKSYTASKCDPPRGPLVGNWKNEVSPVMTVYKLVTVEFKWFGLQGSTESFIMNYEHKLFNQFNRQVYCTMNE